MVWKVYVVDDGPRDGRFYAALSSSSSSSSSSNDFVVSSGVDTFCPRLFFCSEVCRDDAWNAMALVFRSNHCEEVYVSSVFSRHVSSPTYPIHVTLPPFQVSRKKCSKGKPYLKAR